MVKILQINSVVSYGSTGRIAEEIAQKIEEHGWESYIAYGRKKGVSSSRLIKIGNKFDNYIHGISSRIFDNHGFMSKNATQELIRKIKNIKPDIIHLHNLHGYYLNVNILFDFLKKNQIPVVWTLHDCWSITGHCAHFDHIKCNKWKSLCAQCSQKSAYPKSFLRDNSTRNFLTKQELFTSLDHLYLVPVSQWLNSIIKESFLSKYYSQVIHNGINISLFSPVNFKNIDKKYNIYNKFVILGVASVWSEQKGLNDFIKLAEMVSPEQQIILVGLSPEQQRKLPSRIIGISRTENLEELVQLYSRADVFMNLTYEDTFPTTNLEALSCGTPVITYNTGGSVEVINENTGFIIEQGNLESIFPVLDEISNRGGKYFYCNKCRKYLIDNYNKEERYNEYIELYTKILDKA